MPMSLVSAVNSHVSVLSLFHIHFTLSTSGTLSSPHLSFSRIFQLCSSSISSSSSSNSGTGETWCPQGLSGEPWGQLGRMCGKGDI